MYDLYMIEFVCLRFLKIVLVHHFDEIEFNFVTWVFYNEINNGFLMVMFHILLILLLSKIFW